MMLNENYQITAYNSHWCTLRWTVADAALASWIILNGGEQSYGPLLTGERDRSLRIPFEADEVQALEIHDLPPEEIAEAIFTAPNTRPILRWNAVNDVIRYRVYHQMESSPEERIYDGDNTILQIRCPVELTGTGGVWHFLRVEAVDEYGNESTRQSWRFYAYDLPSPPATLAVTNGETPGTFTIEIGG
jgi:hypothetical protein